MTLITPARPCLPAGAPQRVRHPGGATPTQADPDSSCPSLTLLDPACLQVRHGVSATLVEPRPPKLSRYQHKALKERGLTVGEAVVGGGWWRYW